ncbi:uncharacterized protein LOC102290326 isoform X1 [Haplochromis burtoni]|uniref:uncharacterized protein LOC102290326 isoform X1 n=1 Tax=Haplochromis burtoni TaxID=8153 RepID=UPI001C2D3DA8|nr:uncharacterized protein LOC102290326 isoform X1 [Haplochromis burtoni]
MGTILDSWRITPAVIITILHIQAVIGTKTTVFSGVEGESFVFRCEYPNGLTENLKYLCRIDECSSYLIMTDKHNRWETKGRFSMYDNTTGSFFIVKVDKLRLNDSGTYQCGVDISLQPDYHSAIKLNVSQAYEPQLLFHLPLVLTAVMCVAALMFVCLFTLCLLLVLKHRRSIPPQNKEITSDYETMMPGLKAEPQCCCSCSAPNCSDPSSLPLPPPPDLCSSFPKHRESALSFGVGEYVDVDVLGNICQYQHLDLSQLEEHVYHSLHVHSCPKHEPIKEEMNCLNVKR